MGVIVRLWTFLFVLTTVALLSAPLTGATSTNSKVVVPSTSVVASGGNAVQSSGTVTAPLTGATSTNSTLVVPSTSVVASGGGDNVVQSSGTVTAPLTGATSTNSTLVVPSTSVVASGGGDNVVQSSGTVTAPLTGATSTNSTLVVPSTSVVASGGGDNVVQSSGTVTAPLTGATSTNSTLVVPSTSVVASGGGDNVVQSSGTVTAPLTGATSTNSTLVVPSTSVVASGGGDNVVQSSGTVTAPLTGATSTNSTLVVPSTSVVASGGGDNVVQSSGTVTAPLTSVVLSVSGGPLTSTVSSVGGGPSTSIVSSGGGVGPSTSIVSSVGDGGVGPSTSIVSSGGGVDPSTSIVSSGGDGGVGPSTSIVSSGGDGGVGPPTSIVSSVGPLISVVSSVGGGVTPPMTSDVAVSSKSSALPTSILSPSSTRQKPTEVTSRTVPEMAKITYYQYDMSFTLNGLSEESQERRCGINKRDVVVLRLLINECTPRFTESTSLHYQIFQRCIEEEIRGLFPEYNCSVRVIKLECGSVKGDYAVTLGVNSSMSATITNSTGFTKVKKEIEEGKLGAFVAEKTSFVSKEFKKEVSAPRPTKEIPTEEIYNVYFIVTMSFTWKKFCTEVEKQFKEKVAEHFDDERVKPDNIYVIDREKYCDRPDDNAQEIEVPFVVLGKDQDKLTILVGEYLMDLVDSGQTRKLGNLLKDKIKEVEFGGPDAPKRSGLSDKDKIWLGVGVTLGVIFLLVLFYLCCCRQTEKKPDSERGPSYFGMDEMDNAKTADTALVNDGFDDQERTHTPLSQSVSTFKNAAENGEKPATKNDDTEVPALLSNENSAPLGQGEDTDDELDMTVQDVAIEPSDMKGPSTSPTIPPDPSHMAIKDIAKFLEEIGDENKKDKEYEDLDKSMTPSDTYAINTKDRNRSDDIVPKPETRVKIPGENDYINANFVKDHHGKDSFIVTQHPLSNTMRDFWSMVWDKNVSVIVMVNNNEKDLENYHNYWMDHKNSLTIYGHMQVKTSQADNRAGFNLTKFVLQNSQETDKTRTVNHFRFTNWTEKEPSVEEFANFVRSIEEFRLENPKPVVVHCSGGQGYTGVVLATDIGLRVYNESDKKSVIDVFDCVEKMRKDRNGIVCSKELYNFVYKVLSVFTKNVDTIDSKL